MTCTPREKRGRGGCDPSLLTRLDKYSVSDTGLLLKYLIPNPFSPHIVAYVSVSHGFGALIVVFNLFRLVHVLHLCFLPVSKLTLFNFFLSVLITVLSLFLFLFSVICFLLLVVLSILDFVAHHHDYVYFFDVPFLVFRLQLFMIFFLLVPVSSCSYRCSCSLVSSCS